MTAPGFELTRVIPVPASVSEQAQQFLGMGLGLGDGGQEPERHDLDAWRALIETGNAAVIAMTELLPPSPASTVEVTAVDDVPVFVLTPDGVPDDPDQPIYFDIHGGALIMGGGDACRAIATQIVGDGAHEDVVRRLPHAARPPLPRRARRLPRGLPPSARASPARAHRGRRRIGRRQPRRPR